MTGNRERDVIQEFGQRRSRQIFAIVVTIALMVIILWKQDHPGLFLGQLSPSAILWTEISLMAIFVVFSAVNWRCPECSRYLGHSINRPGCRKCGARFR